MISPETIEKIKALMEEASVFEEDLEESFILGSGPGGQKTNKTSSTVRLSHEPSAISVRCGETRSRETNRWLARRMLAEEVLCTPESGEDQAPEAPQVAKAAGEDACGQAGALGDKSGAKASLGGGRVGWKWALRPP